MALVDFFVLPLMDVSRGPGWVQQMVLEPFELHGDRRQLFGSIEVPIGNGSNLSGFKTSMQASRHKLCGRKAGEGGTCRICKGGRKNRTRTPEKMDLELPDIFFIIYI